MSDKKILKPSQENLIVRDPVTKVALSKDGEPKTLNTYWRKRLADGSVVEVVSTQKVETKVFAEKKGESK